MIVVDTNVVSELMRAYPSPLVIEWVRNQNDRNMHTTSITLAEIYYGIQRLPQGRRKDLLRATADEVFAAFVAQVIPFDGKAATHYGAVVLRRERTGRSIDGFDAQIASICISRGATLATRNLKDFQGTGVVAIDPWHSA